MSRGGATNKVLNRGFSSVHLALLIDSVSDSLEQRLPLTVPSRTHVLAWPLSIRSLSYSLSSFTWINKLSFWATKRHIYVHYCTIGHSSCHRRSVICWRDHRERTCVGITWGRHTPNYLEKLLNTVVIPSQLSIHRTPPPPQVWSRLNEKGRRKNCLLDCSRSYSICMNSSGVGCFCTPHHFWSSE